MTEDDNEPDAAAEAFEGVRGELARQSDEIVLLRRAIEGIAAARDDRLELPDYSETLGQLTNFASATYQRAEILRKAAEEETVARQVVARVAGAVAEDRQAVKTAAGELRDATRALQGVTVSARRGDQQNRWLIWTAIVGIVVGMILWAVFAGIVARAVPTGWQWPERMAARTLDMPMWEGGQRMMRTAAPDAFANMAAGDRIVIANRETIEGCSKAAARTREPVRCTIRVKPEEKQ
ncbi:DUF6118 family protein [Sphingomonas sp. 10B4]|uniref:DUF6118 family protein n=1 Tax=Sphingomonas sp. 10B4 TaxID=3048575 RepID=UPI002AB46D47|nr:DUF6118 family protein [Sphingomonas sp. 10B4]MDY7526188.1 DUF6118 family protein [Sphingomonas sp. 10B4]MEB0284358.1 DUF6118 family protein [Sphingomonas sp. 10B4]